MAQHLLRHTAQQELLQSSEPLRAHHDEVRPFVSRHVEQALGGIAGMKGEKHDWVHALAVVGLTLVFIGMVYVVVAVVL